MNKTNEIGVIGTGVMGAALTKNFQSRGFQVAAYDRNYESSTRVASVCKGKVQAYETLEMFVESLEKPRRIFMMLPAGHIVDDTIALLIELLDKGDIIMDGGNSFFLDTRRRNQELTELGFHYFGVGVSGGEQGALIGPSIMPGGNEQGYEAIRPYLEAISAKKDGEPCCAYMGEDGAGHFVKMVHNGIEYADMQLIAEVYLFLKQVLNKSNAEIASILEEWNQGEAKSYLIEISAKVLREKDPETEGDLIDYIEDASSQKGTGKWTSIQSFEVGVDISMITAALQARIVSNLKKEREIIGNYARNTENVMGLALNEMKIEEVQKAYYLAKVAAYAQGFAMMKEAGKTYGWELDLENIASTFRAGCIIQADFLEVIMRVYKSQEDLANLLLHDEMKSIVLQNEKDLRIFNIYAIAKKVPTPVISSALMYLDQLKSPLLGANLIQGQRDYFGSHTFHRIDKEGVFHHGWN